MSTPLQQFTSELPAAARDFDFLTGKWAVHNRRLVERLADCDEWSEFDATLEVRPILAGLGNMDQYRITAGGRYFEGVSLRLLDLASHHWSIYWVDTDTGRLQPPVIGQFTDGVGTFHGADTCNGQPVNARFVWSDITENSARWEQAYSPDEGETWETNWVMEFQRQ